VIRTHFSIRALWRVRSIEFKRRRLTANELSPKVGDGLIFQAAVAA
jgi:hypothetical protein